MAAKTSCGVRPVETIEHPRQRRAQSGVCGLRGRRERRAQKDDAEIGVLTDRLEGRLDGGADAGADPRAPRRDRRRRSPPRCERSPRPPCGGRARTDARCPVWARRARPGTPRYRPPRPDLRGRSWSAPLRRAAGQLVHQRRCDRLGDVALAHLLQAAPCRHAVDLEHRRRAVGGRRARRRRRFRRRPLPPRQSRDAPSSDRARRPRVGRPA